MLQYNRDLNPYEYDFGIDVSFSFYLILSQIKIIKCMANAIDCK